MIFTGDNKEITRIMTGDGKEIIEVRDGQGRIIYQTAVDMLGDSPLLFQGKGKPLSQYKIWGNSYQDGVPDPDNPVEVQSCGDRTAQLIPYPFYTESGTVNGIEWTVYGDGRVTATGTTTKGTNLYFINASSGFSLKAGTYTMKFYGDKNRKIQLRDIDNNVVLASIPGTTAEKKVTFTLDSDSGACSLYFNEPTTGAVFNIDGYLMLNEGSTALPYEQNLFKIPVTVSDGTNSQTYPIYLSEPLRKQLNGDAADEINYTTQTLTRRVDANCDPLQTPTTETITAPTIPTINGQNTLAVDTTLPPSQLSITGRIKPSPSYGKLLDSNNVLICDKNGIQLKVIG